MVEKRFNKLGVPDIERFENYLPTAFSSELTLLQKVNKIIQDLIASNKLTNEMVDYLNNFIETFDEKVYQKLEDVLSKWLEDGFLTDLIRDVINEEVVEARNDYLGKKYANLKERLDSEKAEVVEARNDYLGKKYVNLKERLDSEKADVVEVTAQLDNKAKNALRYGELTLPDWVVPKLPFSFYRYLDNVIRHNFDFNKYKKGTKIYVDYSSGNDSSGNGNSESPYKTLNKALDLAISGLESSYVIEVKNTDILMKDECFGNKQKIISGKQISIISNNELTVTQGRRNLSWTNVGDGAYKTTSVETYGVYDLNYVDVFGCNIPYKNVSTLEECKLTKCSWYYNGSDVYVHTYNGLQPDDNIQVCVYFPTLNVSLLNGAILYIENVKFLSAKNGNGVDISTSTITEENTCKFIANKCKFIGGYISKRTNQFGSNNCLGLNNVKETYIFDSIACYGYNDGFNFAYSLIPSENRKQYVGLCLGCISYNNGLDNTGEKNNNAFTGHNGATIININCIGYNTNGPILSNVHGCDTICIDCNMRDSYQGASSAYAINGENIGKTYLENCGAGGNVTNDLELYYTETQIKSGFKGRRITNNKPSLMTYLD